MIYLDNNATTMLDPRVLDAMSSYLKDRYGNAASHTHPAGWRAMQAVTHARSQLAKLIAAKSSEITWTSGATEANNLALFGATAPHEGHARHLITSTVEHPSVVDPCKELERRGWRISWLRPDATGRIDIAQVRNHICSETLMVSLMYGNNELGTLNPIADIGAMCRERGVLLHSDATQALGKIPVDVGTLQVDMLTGSAHKFHGPMGVGFLYLRRTHPTIDVKPLLFGGGHQVLRSGTANLPGIVGCGAAAELAIKEIGPASQRMNTLRQRLWDLLRRRLDGISINGHARHHLPNTLNVCIHHVLGESLIKCLIEESRQGGKVEAIAVSTGSACGTATPTPSHVLEGIGLSNDDNLSSIRFSLSKFTTEKEIETAAERIIFEVMEIRRLSPIPPVEKTQLEPDPRNNKEICGES